MPLSAGASQPTGWPRVASHMSIGMTHQLPSKFNSLDASPSNVPILLEEAAREDGVKKQAEVICNYTEWIRPPTSFHCTHTLRDNEMEGRLLFFIYHKSCESSRSYLRCQRNPFTASLLKAVKSLSINTSKHPMWVVDSI